MSTMTTYLTLAAVVLRSQTPGLILLIAWVEAGSDRRVISDIECSYLCYCLHSTVTVQI